MYWLPQWRSNGSAQGPPSSYAARCSCAASFLGRLSLLAKAKPERSKVKSNENVKFEVGSKRKSTQLEYVGPLRTCRRAKSRKEGAPQPSTRLLPTKGLDGTLSYRKRKAEDEANVEPDAVTPPPPFPPPRALSQSILTAHCVWASELFIFDQSAVLKILLDPVGALHALLCSRATLHKWQPLGSCSLTPDADPELYRTRALNELMYLAVSMWL